MRTKTYCLACGCRMQGELDHGPPCHCVSPVYIAYTDWESFRVEREKYKADPDNYRPPWADEPEPEVHSTEDMLRIAEQRYGTTFVLPIRAEFKKD